MYDEVRRIGLNPNINNTLGDLIITCKRDLKGSFVEGAAQRYDQIYLIKDGNLMVPILVVECDGVDGHTKEEDIKRDARKEHILNDHFPHVLTLGFTGSEIKNSKEKCGTIIKNTFDFLVSIYPQMKANPDMVKQLRKTATHQLVPLLTSDS